MTPLSRWRRSSWPIVVLLLCACQTPQAPPPPNPDGEPQDVDEPEGLPGPLDQVGLWSAGLQVEAMDDNPIMLQAPRDAPPHPPAADPDAKPPKRGEFFAAPIPFSDPQLGYGLGAAAGYIFRLDKEDLESKPSTAAVAGMSSSNGSDAVGGFFDGSAGQDRWRFQSGGGAGTIFYKFYGIGSDRGGKSDSVDLKSELWAFSAQLLRRLDFEWFGVRPKGLFLGPKLSIARVQTSIRDDVGFGLLPSSSRPDREQLDVLLPMAGARLRWDTRDNSFSPREGSLLDLDVDFQEKAFGGDFSYRTYSVAIRHYVEVAEGVLAGRLIGRFTDGEVPFFDLSNHNLRGYEPGRFRDRHHAAAELEFRHPIWWRFGGVAFLGAGKVAPQVHEFGPQDLLWSAGFGVRVQLTKKTPLHYAVDVGWGREGSFLYIGLGEAF